MKYQKKLYLKRNSFQNHGFKLLKNIKDFIIKRLYTLPITFQTQEYRSNDLVSKPISIPNIPEINLPIGFINRGPTYEDLLEHYMNDIDSHYIYEIVKKDDNVILKHTQKNISPNENLLFPSRIFLKNKIDKITYTITSRHNEDIIMKTLSIKE